jgi:aspartate dehydrogenase
MDIALIGCGFIGTFIAEQIASDELSLRLKIVLDRHKEKVERVQEMFPESPDAASGIDDILSSNVDLVIEAASIGAVHAFAEPILSSGKDMLIMSVGAFSNPEFYNRIARVCKKTNTTVYIPTGAVGAIDAVFSASQGELEIVELTTIKSPRSLEGAPFIVETGIDMHNIKKRTEIFSGSAKEAIEGFPFNVNVAIMLSLAGIGSERTKVRIIADPKAKVNIHEVMARGDFGSLSFRTENLPSRENPKTSLLAALSAVATLKKITESIKIG